MADVTDIRDERVAPATTDCCRTKMQATCCEPAEKANCCSTAHTRGSGGCQSSLEAPAR